MCISYVGFPLLVSPQLLPFMLFQYPNFSCTLVPLSNFLHAFGFNISICLSTTSCAHLVSISNFPAMYLSSNFLNFLHLLGFNIYAKSMLSRECSAPLLVTHWVNFYSSLLFRPFSCAGAQLGVSLCESAPLGGIHLVSISKLPTLVPLSNFLHSFTWCQSRLPLWSLNNFLHASQLWFQCLRFPPCLSEASCAHLVSISNLPPVPSCASHQAS